ncbi:cyclic diguanosine monophosphate-binding protein [Psychromonas marina]|uniref:Cyclic diguanosine monophosphate-binding protein n=1 Tax=Psychromonas marina TaxID=88364 RepID=A0ABQ6E394_9GAMM|nr:PilZ domain-containing protein [Psychromonas marina]GLS91663.1 cyclic diguanosine monophosphate-binding protein [Psychromonas marina]
MVERRRFSRVIFSGHCSLSEEIAGEIEIFETEIIDISLNGALVRRPEEWHDEPDIMINLNLTLSGSEIILEINGVVCHQAEGLLGIKFLTLSLESLSHLRRLIELNLADEDLMNREISQLINLSES